MVVKYPKVVVLLAAYNGVQWLEEQLNTILTQVRVEITVYISIDPSIDGTEALCATYAAHHKNVILIGRSDGLTGSSRNFFRLIREVDFEPYDYVAFSDQDDIWHVNKAIRAVEALETLNVDAYSSNVTAFWNNGDKHLLDKAQPQVQWDFLFEAAGPGCTYMFKKFLAEEIKASISDNWIRIQNVALHDWYCYAFARSHGYRWFIDPEPSMEYRQHSLNQVGANKGLKSFISRYRTVLDGRWFRQVQLIVELVGLKSSPFVKDWIELSRGNLIRLSFSAASCRRRMRDKYLFFIICLSAAIRRGE